MHTSKHAALRVDCRMTIEALFSLTEQMRSDCWPVSLIDPESVISSSFDAVSFTWSSTSRQRHLKRKIFRGYVNESIDQMLHRTCGSQRLHGCVSANGYAK